MAGVKTGGKLFSTKATGTSVRFVASHIRSKTNIRKI